jgi:hypothetical protein
LKKELKKKNTSASIIIEFMGLIASRAKLISDLTVYCRFCIPLSFVSLKKSKKLPIYSEIKVIVYSVVSGKV